MIEWNFEKEDHYLEEPFDEDFWLKVEGKFSTSNKGMAWNRAMDEVRIERLLAKHGKDALLVIIRDWPKSEKYKNEPELVTSLEYLINRFTEIVLERDCNQEYKYYRDDEDPAHPTLLHLAAERNFLYIAKVLVGKYPSLLNMETEQVGDEREYLPVEKALMSFNDETAAYLMSEMTPESVHELFLYDYDLKKAKFSFGHLISHKSLQTGKHDMKKTVLAVLDHLVNPYWPYLPHMTRELVEASDRIERARSNVPEDPLNYDFLYHVLEADENGRQPFRNENTLNNMFHLKSVSCLRLIAESQDKDAILHPVVRMLVTRKWKKFGHWWFCVQAAFYVLFLTVLSFALIHGSTQDDPTQYSGKANGLRLFCEILSILLLMIYFLKEVDEAERDWQSYFTDPYNYFDWLGLVLTAIVIPLRLYKVNSQWLVAGLGYLFNFLRLFKFSCLCRTTGLYTKTLARIICRDMSRFSVVFLVAFLGFCGAVFISLKATGQQDMFLDYGGLMVAAVRTLVEQQTLVGDYSKFNWLAILIILAYMAMVIVILLNVLIAQLSYTYDEAKSNAKLQYAIDRIVIATRIEYSRFARFNLRVGYYLDREMVSEGTLAEEILEYNEERNPWESMEEKLSQVRDMMRKVVRKQRGETERNEFFIVPEPQAQRSQ